MRKICYKINPLKIYFVGFDPIFVSHNAIQCTLDGDPRRKRIMDTNVRKCTCARSFLALLIVRIGICSVPDNFRNEFHRTVRCGDRRGVEQRRKLSRLPSVVGTAASRRRQERSERRGKREMIRTKIRRGLPPTSPRALVTDKTDVQRSFARNRAYKYWS